MGQDGMPESLKRSVALGDIHDESIKGIRKEMEYRKAEVAAAEYEKRRRSAVAYLFVFLSVSALSLAYLSLTSIKFKSDWIAFLGIASGFLFVLLFVYQYLMGVNPFHKKENKDFVDDALIERIDAPTPPADSDDVFNWSVEESFYSIQVRIKDEISSLSRRGNLNLMIGVGTSAVAVGLLVYVVLWDNGGSSTMAEVLAHYAPRVMLSVFIEIFSFFFLKLYSAGLQDIKYYQNELTNLEAKFIALNKAVELKDKTSTAKILISLSLTERNGILKKGETTQDIERLRQSQQNEKELLSALMSLVKTKP
ncbi:hypothetical protein [Chromobacterium vaccinii]|uniref:hypothetical protein n=1 Tax=Chromobacterium vaccinii TaxID=1108595 RepID=UPI0011AB8347|nr:hypothetical protein [Chromobacterium vaccinii]